MCLNGKKKALHDKSFWHEFWAACEREACERYIHPFFKERRRARKKIDEEIGLSEVSFFIRLVHRVKKKEIILSPHWIFRSFHFQMHFTKIYQNVVSVCGRGANKFYQNIYIHLARRDKTMESSENEMNGKKHKKLKFNGVFPTKINPFVEFECFLILLSTRKKVQDLLSSMGVFYQSIFSVVYQFKFSNQPCFEWGEESI
jgi:hypothetical protein